MGIWKRISSWWEKDKVEAAEERAEGEHLPEDPLAEEGTQAGMGRPAPYTPADYERDSEAPPR